MVSAVSRCAVALATPKSIIRGAGFPSTSPTSMFRRLQIAMQDGFLVRMLHAFAHRNEQFQPLPHGQLVLVAIIRDGHAGDILHHEVGPALRRGAGPTS